MIGYELVRMGHMCRRLRSLSKLDRCGCIDSCSLDLVNNIQGCKQSNKLKSYSLRNYQKDNFVYKVVDDLILLILALCCRH